MTRRGTTAATVAAAAVALLALAVVHSAFAAVDGAYALLVAPALGLGVGIAVFRALRTVCSTGRPGAGTRATAGVATLLIGGLAGVSFGGLALLLPGLLLAFAAAITPPARA